MDHGGLATENEAMKEEKSCVNRTYSYKLLGAKYVNICPCKHLCYTSKVARHYHIIKSSYFSCSQPTQICPFLFSSVRPASSCTIEPRINLSQRSYKLILFDSLLLAVRTKHKFFWNKNLQQSCSCEPWSTCRICGFGQKSRS